MGENSSIEWTDHTFNPWWGCTRVSPGCDNCYADTWSRRLGMSLWDGQERRTFGAKHWAEPVKWNRKAEKESRRLRVFCASMADVFDKDAPGRERENLWDLIEDTPHLDWLLLTKRISNVKRMLPAPPRNVWLGISVVNQQEADRDIPKLLEIEAAVRFLSCEPLLGPIEFPLPCRGSVFWGGLHWVIVGGESGPGARPFVLGWGKEIVRQCRAAGAPVFVKQVGSRPTNREGERCPHVKDRKGGDPWEWPGELRVREWPQ